VLRNTFNYSETIFCALSLSSRETCYLARCRAYSPRFLLARPSPSALCALIYPVAYAVTYYLLSLLIYLILSYSFGHSDAIARPRTVHSTIHSITYPYSLSHITIFALAFSIHTFILSLSLHSQICFNCLFIPQSFYTVNISSFHTIHISYIYKLFATYIYL
jgi:hypothetical protein